MSRTAARHGTESGYYRHIRQTNGGDTVEWPAVACAACLAAHSAREAQRRVGKPPRVRPNRTRHQRVCACGSTTTARSGMCRSCAQKSRAAAQRASEAPTWVRVGLVWKAA